MPSTKHDNDFSDLMAENVDRVTISNTALDAAIEYIGKHLEPIDVFSEGELSVWAENNGYVKS